MLKNLTQYNIWANDIISGYILQASAVVDQPVVSSFTSIRKTLYHIWDAQVIWHTRLKGLSLSEWPSKTFNGTLEDACSGLQNSSKELNSYVMENGASKMISYNTIDGKEFSSSVEEIITHVVNHGTYHRGQLITLLRQCGYTDVGSTDYIRFARK